MGRKKKVKVEDISSELIESITEDKVNIDKEWENIDADWEAVDDPLTKEAEKIFPNISNNDSFAQNIKSDNIKTNFLNIEGRLIHVRVGNEHNPASDKEIKAIETGLNRLLEEAGLSSRCLLFVTHHAIDISLI